MLHLIRYLKGYVCIVLSGYAPERFMNLCRSNGLILWDIRPNKNEYLIKMSIEDYKRIKAFLKKTKVRAAIIKKCGLPFFMSRNRKRKIFFFGIPICLLILYILTQFIWSFEIRGNKQVTDEMLEHFLSRHNIQIGCNSKHIPIEKLETELREEFDCITWTSIKIEGTQLVIDIKENDLTPTKEKEYSEGNKTCIIAKQDGIIISIVTRRGIPKVKKGDEVKRGDILVEGAIPILDNDGNIIQYEYCDSDADVFLKYRYPVLKSISRYYQYKNYSGRSRMKKYIRIGSKSLSWQLKKIPYLKYDMIQEEKQISLLKGMKLPIYLGRKIYQEYTITDALYSEDKAKEILEKSFMKEIEELKEKGVQIIENNVKIEKNSNNIQLSGYMDVIERNIEKREQQEIILNHTENDTAE